MLSVSKRSKLRDPPGQFWRVVRRMSSSRREWEWFEPIPRYSVPIAPSVKGVWPSKIRGVSAPLIFAPRGPPFASGDGGVVGDDDDELAEFSPASGAAVGWSGERVKYTTLARDPPI